jgi:hypothetical protein
LPSEKPRFIGISAVSTDLVQDVTVLDRELIAQEAASEGNASSMDAKAPSVCDVFRGGADIIKNAQRVIT